jgi:hypothetical protein
VFPAVPPVGAALAGTAVGGGCTTRPAVGDGIAGATVTSGAGLRQDDDPRAWLASVLRLTRRLALEPDPDALLRELLAEAVALLDGAGGAVGRWDAGRKVMVTLHSTMPGLERLDHVPAGVGVGGLAAQRRRPAIINDYQSASGALPSAVAAGIQAAIAAPVMNEGHLLGAVTVVTTTPGRSFTAQHAELLEVLAGIASAAAAGVERSRLDGALLVARTATHEVNNALTPVLGNLELLALTSAVARDPDAADFVAKIRTAARHLGERVSRLQRIVRVSVAPESPLGPDRPFLDLDRSTERPGEAG